MISHDLTEKFIRNPRLFLKQFLIQIPIGDTNFRTNVFDDYIFKPNYRNRAFDLTQKQASPIAIAELSLKKDKDTDICAYPISSTTSITANWAPYNPRNVQEITLRHETRFFFTAELSRVIDRNIGSTAPCCAAYSTRKKAAHDKLLLKEQISEFNI